MRINIEQSFLRILSFLCYYISVKIYQAHFEKYVVSYRQRKYVKKLRKKNYINVVFLPMNVAMWKYQHLYELLRKDKRFHLYVFLSPAPTFTKEQRCKDLEGMRKYFNQHNVPFVDHELEKNKEVVEICSVVDPDILFYAQPYEGAVEKENMFINFKDKLLCHIPYAFRARGHDFYDDNMRYNNLAWKLYYPTVESKVLAELYAYNHGRNVVVSGYPGADDYLTPTNNDPWKIKDRAIKRIIWAPHFTIAEGLGFSQVSNFLNMAEFMQNIAIEYSNQVSFAFKPHPRLFSVLCQHPDWGEERTKDYYAFWQYSLTTQLETGEFVDLFKGSDAMIHDSGSFTVDYLYFGKPVLYDNPDIEAAKATANETGKAAYDVHYRVKSNDDIRKFVDEVVIAGNDTMKEQREEYYNKYLRPPGGKTVAQNIYDDLVKSLGV